MISRIKKFIAGNRERVRGIVEKNALALFIISLAFLALTVYLFSRNPVNIRVNTNAKNYEVTNKDGKFQVKVYENELKEWEKRYDKLKKSNRKVMDEKTDAEDSVSNLRSDKEYLQNANDGLLKDVEKLEAENKKIEAELESFKVEYEKNPDSFMLRRADLFNDNNEVLIISKTGPFKAPKGFTSYVLICTLDSVNDSEFKVRELYGTEVSGRMGDSRIIDLNRDGINEIVFTTYDRCSCCGDTLIISNYHGKWRSYDSSDLRLGDALKIVENNVDGETYLISTSVMEGNNYYLKAAVPSVYIWSGSQLVPAPLSSRKTYYHKHYIPVIKKEMAALEKNALTDEEWKLGRAYFQKALDIARDAMDGRIRDVRDYVQKREWNYDAKTGKITASLKKDTRGRR